MHTDPLRRASLDGTLWPAVLVLAATLALFECTTLDLTVQDRLFDFTTQRWIVDGGEPVGQLIFYNGPKAAVLAMAAALLALALGPAGWRQRLRLGRRELFVAILTLATVPALAGLGKGITNTFCPAEIRRYGGDGPYVRLCSPYPDNDRPERRGHCFPAGHASGGFALLALAWLRRSRRWRIGGLALGITSGWWMGGYQMFRGAHYLSHTVTTMLIAWIVVLIWRRTLACEGTRCGCA